MPRKSVSEVDWGDMPEPEYVASRLFRALGSPKAYRIVKLLLKHEVLSVEELAAHLHRQPWVVSKMLRPLRDLDVVRFQKDGRYTLYTLKNRKRIEAIVREGEEFGAEAARGR